MVWHIMLNQLFLTKSRWFIVNTVSLVLSMLTTLNYTQPPHLPFPMTPWSPPTCIDSIASCPTSLPAMPATCVSGQDRLPTVALPTPPPPSASHQPTVHKEPSSGHPATSSTIVSSSRTRWPPSRLHHATGEAIATPKHHHGSIYHIHLSAVFEPCHLI